MMIDFDYEKAIYSFFGRTLKIKDTIIITNIYPIYEGILLAADKLISESAGFYKIAEIVFNSVNLYVVKITPGNCIVDCVRLLNKRCKKIIFMGIAASINPNVRIGDICSPVNFIDSFSFDDNFRQGLTITQTDGMIQSKKYYSELYDLGVDVIDMECCDFVAECNKLNLAFSYLVHISDEPLFGEYFYDTKPVPIDVIKMLKKGLMNE